MPDLNADAPGTPAEDDGPRWTDADWDEELDFEDEDDEPVDPFKLDVESWHPRPPLLPRISLLGWVIALPLVSWWLRSLVVERVVREDPDQLGLMDVWGTVIVVSLVAGLILAVSVPVVARIGRHRDTWALALLEHGFQVGAVAAMVVIALHTLLLAGVLFGVLYLLTGWVGTGASAVFVLGGLAAIASFAAAAFDALRDRIQDEPAIAVDRVEAPGLHDAVHELAEQVGADPPATILLGPTMSTWTARTQVEARDGLVRGTMIHVSLPLLAILSEAQVRATLAHELAHTMGGDLEMGARLGRAFARANDGLAALRAEASGLSRLPAKPALAWLSFALDAMAVVVGEHRRRSEFVADEIGARVAGADAVGSGLLLEEALDRFEDAWDDRVHRAVAGEMADPVRGFRAVVRNGLRDLTTAEVIEESLYVLTPQHPALVTRLVAIGQTEAILAMPPEPFLRRALADPAATTRRLIEALRPRDIFEQRLVLNPPRLTAGTLGWLLFGLVVGVILAYRFVVDADELGDLPLIAAILAGVWLLFPVVYPWLQREAIIDQRGIRVRSWWARWLDPEASRFPWTEMRWSPELWLKVDAEARMTLSDGSDQVRWWGTFWPKAERTTLYGALADRGVRIAFTSDVGETDPERHAVVYVLPDHFVIPEVRMTDVGDLVEIDKVKVVPMHQRKFAFALIDRLHDPVPKLKPKDPPFDLVALAASVGLEPDVFDDVATRVVILGTATSWTIGADGDVVASMPRDAVDKADIDEVIWSLMPFRPPAEDDAAEAGEEPPNPGARPVNPEVAGP